MNVTHSKMTDTLPLLFLHNPPSVFAAHMVPNTSGDIHLTFHLTFSRKKLKALWAFKQGHVLNWRALLKLEPLSNSTFHDLNFYVLGHIKYVPCISKDS